MQRKYSTSSVITAIVLFYFLQLKDDDYGGYYLNIVAADKTLHLYYRINQISDYFIHPKITVLKSEKLEKGAYVFFPPIADEIISNHNVGAILNWHEKTESTEKPIKFEMPKNPFESINFGRGIVKDIEQAFSLAHLQQNMLEVSYPHDYLLHVGWYGSEQGFIIYIVKNQDWDNPVAKTHKDLFELEEAVKSAVALIEKMID